MPLRASTSWSSASGRASTPSKSPTVKARTASARRWSSTSRCEASAERPRMIELYTVASANGQRASIVLEESSLPYSARLLDQKQDPAARAEVLAVNPLGKLPVIVDRAGARPVTVYGSMAIALYVAQKSGRFLPEGLRERAEVYHWLGLVCTDLAPAFGGLF